MFKENDNMRPGPTPERVLAICRLLENNSYDQVELYKLSQLSDDPTSEEAVELSEEPQAARLKTQAITRSVVINHFFIFRVSLLTSRCASSRGIPLSLYKALPSRRSDTCEDPRAR